MNRSEPTQFLHSTPAPRWLSHEIEAQYGLRIESCRYLSGGETDTYLVVKESGRRLIARIDREGIRNDDEVAFELDFLDYLAMRGGRVCRALRTLDDKRSFLLQCAEGVRRVVLTDSPPGDAIDRSEPLAAAAMAESIARMHLIAADYCAEVAANAPDSYLHGPRLGKQELLRKPLETLRSICSEAPAALEQLHELSDRICAEINSLGANHWPLGLCHGNLHPASTVIDRQSDVSLTGFENCGIGWPVYDLATIRWHLRREHDERHWHRFIGFYQQYNRLDDSQLNAMSLLTACRHFWGMGRRAVLGRQLGYGFANRDYLSRQINAIRAYLAEFEQSAHSR